MHILAGVCLFLFLICPAQGQTEDWHKQPSFGASDTATAWFSATYWSTAVLDLASTDHCLKKFRDHPDLRCQEMNPLIPLESHGNHNLSVNWSQALALKGAIYAGLLLPRLLSNSDGAKKVTNWSLFVISINQGAVASLNFRF